MHPELEVSLFAAEPMLLSPSNIDIDHRGRVWVCEVVNYRAHQGRRSEGDRILILEDTDGDGRSDHRKVFYQGRDIDSPHGVCVLGNQVVVSAGPQVLCFTDEDGDDRPDRKEIWFSGISGVQHDHGIHKFIFGPDGKLYFNFGNEGKQLGDALGQPIVDLAGNSVAETMQPYQQGMVFRCNPDRTQFETLAWNFRNNWMVAVDSFGGIWQSDNDDDGNRGVRINYVMEFGNYGYRDEMTGAGWRAERTGMAADIPTRHWHQNDPGVVPNLLQTGAGSPTGITVYEGEALTDELEGQLIHCDAGPSVTRAYLLDDAGAGYSARVVNLLHGARDPWFRPSDVQVAPDGSLIVADWYDPGVGGHHMGDLDRGRLFRITAKGQGNAYQVPTFDFATPAGAVTALQNPNNAVRHLAWVALRDMGQRATAALTELSQSDKPQYRARALWLLARIPGLAGPSVEQAERDSDPRMRMLAIRLARQLDEVDAITVAARLIDDESPQVRRECAIALRGNRDARTPGLWSQLAQRFDGQDRWYLEALGIAAEGQWDQCLQAWLEDVHSDWNHPAGRQIIWRSRAEQTPGLLRQIIEDPATSDDELPRYLRAFDFLTGPPHDEVIAELAFNNSLAAGPRKRFVQIEALNRLNPQLLRGQPAWQAPFNQLLDQLVGTASFVELVRRFDLQDRYDEVLSLAIDQPADTAGIDAARMLLAAGQGDRFGVILQEQGSAPQLAAIEVLGRSADNRALPLLVSVSTGGGGSSEVRRLAIHSIASLRAGAEYLIKQSLAGAVPAELTQAVAAELHQVPWSDLREQAATLYPLSPSKDNKPVAAIDELTQRRGDAARGGQIFSTVGTCHKCHLVNGQGSQVGPELSEIGNKLSREALYESIIYPSAGISHSYETFAAELADGNIVTGLMVSQTNEEIEIKNSEGITRRVPRREIEAIVQQPISLMPADIHQNLTEQELVDLVEYLVTLRQATK